MMAASSTFRVPLVFAALLVIAAMGIGMYAIAAILNVDTLDGPRVVRAKGWLQLEADFTGQPNKNPKPRSAVP